MRLFSLERLRAERARIPTRESVDREAVDRATAMLEFLRLPQVAELLQQLHAMNREAIRATDLPAEQRLGKAEAFQQVIDLISALELEAEETLNASE